MVNDTMEGMDEEGLDEAADKEVDSVLYELTEGILGKAPAVPDASIQQVCTCCTRSLFFSISCTPSSHSPRVYAICSHFTFREKYIFHSIL